MKHATIADAPAVLNTNDKAMWVLGYNASPLHAHPTDEQIEAVRRWFIETHACWFTAENLRKMFAVAAGVRAGYGLPGSYVNAAGIGMGDKPHTVVEKLNAAALAADGVIGTVNDQQGEA